MGGVTRPWRLLPVLVLSCAVLVGCGDDGPDDAAEPTLDPMPDPADAPTTVPPAAGDLALEVPEGWYPVPLPSVGVGLALPEGWDAVVLTDDALEQVEGLDVAPGFVDAARNARAAGALLYAADLDDEGGVADLKLARLPGVDLDDAAGGATSAAPDGAEVDRPEGTERPTVRIRFRTEGEDADGAPIVAEGTQWLIEGPDAVWSVIVTSEAEPAGHDELASALLDTVAFPRGT
jgi:hypothetical protein